MTIEDRAQFLSDSRFHCLGFWQTYVCAMQWCCVKAGSSALPRMQGSWAEGKSRGASQHLEKV